MRTIDPDGLPRHYEAAETEAKWMRAWEASGVYRYDPSRSRTETFAVDTPPPTVSGSLHLGHVFSYTHTDVIVRYRRMRGMNIFYPMGWDDNGLPTERRVQNYYHIRCDASAPHDPSWEPAVPGNAERKSPALKVSRENFIRACGDLTRLDEKAFEDLWMRTGISVDWSRSYETIGRSARKAAQHSFIDLFRGGHVYSSDLPTMWDVDFETAVAQAEIEDRIEHSAYHRLPFRIDGSDEYVVIATTRPELLPACVGMTAHPEDPRYRHLFGRKAITPFFGVPVPIFPSPEADPAKGTGILMVCTFGDAADVAWWRREGLPLRQLIGRDGRMSAAEFGTAEFPSAEPARANDVMGAIAGLPAASARQVMAGLIHGPNAFDGFAPGFDPGAPETTEHAVRFYEKGARPIEYIGTRQWFVRLLDKKERLIEMGRRIAWYPDHMRLRYENWTENLVYDWCISRQRSYGVPFPLWYPLDAAGEPDYGRPIVAREEDLPVDPSIDTPHGYQPEDRGRPGGFVAEDDVFDTWFTSSLSPQIAGKRLEDPEGFRRLFPMDLRPQAHEIIRTWAFYTITKAMLHEGTIPWTRVAISGWILDPDRKKMSKSKGNAVTPLEYFDRYSADAVRYWAAGARLGADATFDEKMLATGRRLTVKLYNAAKFVLSKLHPACHETAADSEVTVPLDRSFLAALAGRVVEAETAMEGFDFARALEVTEDFFRHSFTDSYIELAKVRASAGGTDGMSARSTLRTALTTLLRLFAPFLPFVTEEIWSWLHDDPLPVGSIHLTRWPEAAGIEETVHGAGPALFVSASAALSAVHKAKSLAGKSIVTPVTSITLICGPSDRVGIESSEADIMGAGRVERWTLSTDCELPPGTVEAADAVFGDRDIPPTSSAS